MSINSLSHRFKRPAGVGHVRTLNQHPLDEQTVLRRVPDVGLAVTVAVHALEKREKMLRTSSL
uniref:Uncharacterized protein n=1 Tax=Mola mola TaxID=94237 RepID=A0A3Q3WPU9_MOLML